MPPSPIIGGCSVAVTLVEAFCCVARVVCVCLFFVLCVVFCLLRCVGTRVVCVGVFLWLCLGVFVCVVFVLCCVVLRCVVW